MQTTRGESGVGQRPALFFYSGNEGTHTLEITLDQH